jgi:hypothetical protein
MMEIVWRPWLLISTTPPPADPVTDTLIQYGAVGVVALMALAAVRVLFIRMTASLDRETARADRLEEELRRLNDTIRTEYAGTLARTTQVVADATRAVSDASSRRRS